ncbi:hypothetical protein DE146DRAFT_32741 [Phaeosphaeria sp. MPI-PUGE-AT-0046c]|nr:hypothetical protein DE146DRAFT_32741 [Phaeosphaeria sp. MPI-PUGE-AT-0046c]
MLMASAVLLCRSVSAYMFSGKMCIYSRRGISCLTDVVSIFMWGLFLCMPNSDMHAHKRHIHASARSHQGGVQRLLHLRKAAELSNVPLPRSEAVYHFQVIARQLQSISEQSTIRIPSKAARLD